MKINCYTTYRSEKGYVLKYPIEEYPIELEGSYKYVFPMKVYKTEVDRNLKTINKGIYINVYCFSDSTADIARGLEDGDLIQVDGDTENLFYEVDGKRYKASVFRAGRISVLKKPE